MVIVFLFIVALVLGRSFALYQKEDVLQVANGEVIEFCVLGQTWDFPYVEDASGNGYGQEWPVPCDGNYKIELWGASGGRYSSTAPPGTGGYTSGQINLEKGNELTVYVGGAGVYDYSVLTKAGYNGGGISGRSGVEATSGGGATDIRLTGGLWDNDESLKERIMVAAGGAGSDATNTAGSGGGLIGYDAGTASEYALGATQIRGGIYNVTEPVNGSFGKGGTFKSNNGAGGSGYYGGASGYGYAKSGSGGSSFISGHAGSVAITSKTDLTPRNDSDGISCGSSSSKGYNSLGYNTDITCSYHYSGYKFTNTVMIDGEGYNWTTEKGEYVGQVQPDGTTSKGHEGNGYARITYLGYKDSELNGADPVLTSSLVPVIIDDDGVVRKANLKKEWYNYNEKKWANAVVLIDKTKKYDIGEIIPESSIESYFVWIPKYAYKIWDLGLYDSVIEETPSASIAKEIEIRFGLNDTLDILTDECTNSQISGEGSNCHVGDWMTHPAFSAFNANGLWVAKFETTGTIDNLQSKPGVTSLRNQTTSSMFNAAYNYIPTNDSHMMKNTEWGAVAYLSHSKYGINKEININNNPGYLTGYSAIVSPTCYTERDSYCNQYGTNEYVTLPWNTQTGYKASTTGNISGIYDMSGGAMDTLAAYQANKLGNSGFSSDPATLYGTKYFDIYNVNSNFQSYAYRILGDATGEMGPFYRYADNDNSEREHNNWYADESQFVGPNPWFNRGGLYAEGVLAGQFYFYRNNGGSDGSVSFRIVLSDHAR